MFYTLDSKIRYLVQIANKKFYHFLDDNYRTLKLLFDFQSLTNRNKKKKRKI